MVPSQCSKWGSGCIPKGPTKVGQEFWKVGGKQHFIHFMHFVHLIHFIHSIHVSNFITLYTLYTQYTFHKLDIFYTPYTLYTPFTQRKRESAPKGQWKNSAPDKGKGKRQAITFAIEFPQATRRRASTHACTARHETTSRLDPRAPPNLQFIRNRDKVRQGSIVR